MAAILEAGTRPAGAASDFFRIAQDIEAEPWQVSRCSPWLEPAMETACGGELKTES